MRLPSSFFCLPALFLCCSASLLSQPGSASQAPLIKTNARAVVVDVVVTRGNDEPVTGLSRQSFHVSEDGKLQAIDYFEEHT